MITALLSGFPSSAGTDARGQFHAYRLAIEGVEMEAVERAAKLFITGKVPGRNNTFAPSCAEFAEQCRYQEGVIHAERHPRIPPPEPKPIVPVDAWKMRMLAEALKGNQSAIDGIRRLSEQYAETPVKQETAE